MGANSKAIDFVALLVEAHYCLLVDVIRCNNLQFAKPSDVEFFGNNIEHLSCHARQVGQISGINANANRLISLLVQCQCNGTEIHQAGSVNEHMVHFVQQNRT